MHLKLDMVAHTAVNSREAMAHPWIRSQPLLHSELDWLQSWDPISKQHNQCKIKFKLRYNLEVSSGTVFLKFI